MFAAFSKFSVKMCNIDLLSFFWIISERLMTNIFCAYVLSFHLDQTRNSGAVDSSAGIAVLISFNGQLV